MRHPLISLGKASRLIFILLAAPPVVANDPQMNAAEAAILPAWCLVYNQAGNLRPQDTKDPEIAAKLASFMRSGCSGHHHYCWALVWANRGYFRQETDSYPADYYYSVGIADLGYVLQNSQPTCSLIPDMHTKAGEWEALRGRPKEAEERFRKAIGIKPTHSQAYVGLSDLFESLEKNDAAIAVLQLGIKTNPTSSVLKKKIARLQARISGKTEAP
jgi:tetratricopeptide (TPR) repeat protein